MPYSRSQTVIAAILLCGVAPTRSEAQQLFHSPTSPVWARYKYTEQCTAGVRRAVADAPWVAKRMADTVPTSGQSQRPDTLLTEGIEDAWENAVDSPAPTVVAVAQECIAHVLREAPLAAHPATDLPVLMAFAVYARDDSLITAVIARQTELVPPGTVHARARSIVHDVQTLAGMHALSAALLARYTHYVDSLWPDAVAARAMLRAMAIPRLVERGPKSLTASDPYLNADSIDARLRAIQQLAAHRPPGALDPEDELMLAIAGITTQNYGAFVSMLRGQFDSAKALISAGALAGKPAPPVSGQFWFDSTGTPMSPLPPVTGRLALLAFLRPNREQVGPFYTMLRRLHREFPQLDLVLVASTTESVGSRHLPETPEAMARQLSDFYQRELRLPGRLVVDTVLHLPKRAAPDGRVVTVGSLTENRYPHDQAFNVAWYLLDQHGRVLTVVSPGTEGFIREIIRVALTRTDAPSATGSR